MRIADMNPALRWATASRIFGSMKFSLSSESRAYQIHAYDTAGFRIGQQRFDGNLALSPQQVLSPWGPDAFDALSAADFEPIWAKLAPEILVLGAGPEQRWPASALYAALIGRGIGIEIMSTPAACRTYNILSAEGRNVVAALFTA